jgi:NAD(P)-dependent dehydrogenase (short-subunit alcohol dehydrogenase family)
VDIAIANAGVSEEANYFKDTFDDDSNLIEPKYRVIDVNYRAVLNFVKLSLSFLRRQGTVGALSQPPVRQLMRQNTPCLFIAQRNLQ